METKSLAEKLARFAYYCFVRPYLSIRRKIVKRICEKRLEEAKKRAIHEAEVTGSTKYVVLGGKGKFYVYNRGGMLALAKAYKKRTGRSVDWRKLYVFEAAIVPKAPEQEAEK